MPRFVDYQRQCETHGCPLIEVGAERGCLFDFMDEHLGGLTVADVVPDSGPDRPGALVFADGHTLPLLCPHCAEAARLDEPDTLLTHLAGLTLVAFEYVDDDEGRQLLLLFAADPEADLDDETVELVEVATHPESARRLTCPRERRARYRQAG
ncbi:MAG: hypothetical protein KA764_04785 [Anaerolineales bacterium]|nr:hypothetical protein [Anaerolineales bacterium]